MLKMQKKESELFFTRGAEYKWLEGNKFQHKRLVQGEWHEFEADWDDVMHTSFVCPICDSTGQAQGLKVISAFLRDKIKRKDRTIKKSRLSFVYEGKALELERSVIRIPWRTNYHFLYG